MKHTENCISPRPWSMERKGSFNRLISDRNGRYVAVCAKGNAGRIVEAVNAYESEDIVKCRQLVVSAVLKNKAIKDCLEFGCTNCEHSKGKDNDCNVREVVKAIKSYIEAVRRNG